MDPRRLGRNACHCEIRDSLSVLREYDSIRRLTDRRESGLNLEPASRVQPKGLAMGILDSLENSPALKSALSQLGAPVLPVVMSEVMGTGSQGGLNAIVAKLQQAGLGDQVKSWIGTGH